MKKILIIGSTGYVGKKLKLKLSSKYSLICPNRKNVFDIKKKVNLEKYFNEDIDYVINLSGQQNIKKSEMINVIEIGNNNILKIAQKIKKKVTLIFVSTSLVYGYSKKTKNEKSKTNPLKSYEKIKLKMEKKYIKSNKNYLILRFCNIYGGGDKRGIIGLILRAIRKNKNFYFDNINTYKNFIHINDVVNIIDGLIEKNIKNKILNIGNQNILFSKLSNFLSKLINNSTKFYNKNLSLRESSSQKIDNKIIKNIMPDYQFKSLQNYLKDEIKN